MTKYLFLIIFQQFIKKNCKIFVFISNRLLYLLFITHYKLFFYGHIYFRIPDSSDPSCLLIPLQNYLMLCDIL